MMLAFYQPDGAEGKSNRVLAREKELVDPDQFFGVDAA